jgi:hypothetical protein
VRRTGGLRGGRVLAVLIVAGGVVLAACGSGGNGQSLAQQACLHVHRSVLDYERSVVAGTATGRVAELQKEANQQLRDALPLAAQANSDDGSWNSLMTTISEGADIDEGHLLPSLKAQCVVANTNTNVNPNPQNQNPNPASPAG